MIQPSDAIGTTLALTGWASLLLASTVGAAGAQTTPFRPPAVPLVTHNPYFSVWSMSDRLTDDWSRHWTGSIQAMCGMARIDGRPYRFAGPQPETVPTMDQIGLSVLPTRTVYTFAGGGVQLTLTFLSPLLPDDLDVLSRPVTYVTWEARATDRRKHHVALYFDCSGEWVVDNADQAVVWERSQNETLQTLRIGTQAQPILAKKGDNLRIDWGYFYLAVPNQKDTRTLVASDRAARDGFAIHGSLPTQEDTRMPRAAKDEWPVLASTFDLGQVGAAPVSRHLMLAYDDIYAIELLGHRLRPYWRRNGRDADAPLLGVATLLRTAQADYPALDKRCRAFDTALMADLTREGGAAYAQLAALAYRQCLAAHGLACDDAGHPLLFPKENFSNGCISTVDVLYPSSPFFLLFNTELLRAQLTPVLDYAQSSRWRFPFAPHDLGTFPLANGQVYGGGEKDETDQMPVEESGNMLLMMAAMAKVDGHADYAQHYWPLLTRWAQYLRDKGLDPENQLCTDDFAGHLAHNANLSLKAILALGGYAMLCDMTGRKEEGDEYRRTAHTMADKWVTMASDGDHYRLTFDRPNTWSQKYNLVWDRLLGLNLFPSQVAKTEVAYYLHAQKPFGLPLDNRSAYTKLDWTVWSATLAESPQDFEAFIAPLYRFANTSPSRVPLTDWFWTTDGKQTGFQARSVVGGIFIKMLADPTMWRHWAGRAHHAP